MSDHFVYWYHYPDHTNYKLDGYIGVTKNLNKRDKQHQSDQRFSCYEEIKPVVRTIIFEGTENECYNLEKKLRPVENIGWNVAPGGNGGFKGNHYVTQNGMPWNHKSQETRRKRLASGEIQVWNKDKKLEGKHLDAARKALPNRAPWIYIIEHKVTKEKFEVIGRKGIQELSGFINIDAKSFPYTIIEKKPQISKRNIS